jgi:hypothetical protein
MKCLALLCAIAVGACTSRPVAPAVPPEAWVSVQHGDGRPAAGFAVRKERYLPGMEPAIGGNLHIDARDPKRRVINGWGLYGWAQDNSVRVVLLNEVELLPAERPPGNRPDRPVLRWEERAAYTLTLGESRAIDEAPSLGLGPMTIRLDPKPPGG